LKMFQSWGSSSRLNRLRKLPTPVRRGSPAVAQTGPLSASASLRMVRNLTIRKLSPPWPTRSWEIRTGPGEVSFTRMEITASSGGLAGPRHHRTPPEVGARRQHVADHARQLVAVVREHPDPLDDQVGRGPVADHEGPVRADAGRAPGRRPAPQAIACDRRQQA